MAHRQDVSRDPVVPAIGNMTQERRESLERRLEDGYRRIDEAIVAGTEVTEWESFWIKLLREYEDICHEHDRAA